MKRNTGRHTSPHSSSHSPSSHSHVQPPPRHSPSTSSPHPKHSSPHANHPPSLPLPLPPSLPLPLPASWVVVSDPMDATKTHYKDLCSGVISLSHPLHLKAQRRANLAPLPTGWARHADTYVHEDGEVSLLTKRRRRRRRRRRRVERGEEEKRRDEGRRGDVHEDLVEVSEYHPLFQNFLNELANTTRVSLSHQPSHASSPTHQRGEREHRNGSGRDSESASATDSDLVLDQTDSNIIPTSEQLHQRRKELASMNWENHSLKLEIKYLKRKLSRVVYGEKPPPKPDRTSRFRRHGPQSAHPPTSSNNTHNDNPNAHQYKGPFFGVPLEELLQHEGEGAKIPHIPRTLLNLLEDDVIVCTEGIFRLSPSVTQLQDIKDKTNKGEPLDLEILREDPHIAAALLKQFLRDLPNPVLTPTTQIYSQFLEIQQDSQKDPLPQLKVLISSLPKANRVLLRRSDLDRSISRSSGRLSSFSKSPNSLKEEMQRVQLINHLTTILFSNPSLFGPAESDAASRASLERSHAPRAAPPRTGEDAEDGMWGEGWGWSFQGPKFSVQSEEQKLAHNQHTQYSHFMQHRHVYAQLIRAVQAQPLPLAVAGLRLDKTEGRSLASLAAYTLYDPLTVDGLTSWRWLAQVAAAWAGVSCTELCESVYGERVQTNDKSLEEEIEIEEEDEEEEEEDELFNFDEGSPPQPKIKNNQERGERKESSKESEVVPAPFLAYVLMYFAKNREFIDYLKRVVKPAVQTLLHFSDQLDIKFIEPVQGAAKPFIGVEVDIEALQTVTTQILESILREDAIAIIPADIVFVCRLLFKTGRFDQEPQLLFRWFFFRLYLLRAFASPEEYELCEEIKPTQQQVLRSVECVLSNVAQIPPSFPCPSHTCSLRPEDEALQYHITKLCEYDLQGYVSRYRTSVDALGQRIVLSPIVLHPLYKPPEFTGVVSTSLVEIYSLHRILLNLTVEKESIGNGTPLRLILETIREPPSSLRDDDDVFVILNLTNFISNLPTFLDNGEEINKGEINAADAELDNLVRMADDLKRQRLEFEASQKKSSIQMRTLSESIRKLTASLDSQSLFIQQVVQDYTQLRDAVTLARKYKKDLQDTKIMLTKKLQLTFLDLLAAKQPEDIYPKNTRTPQDHPTSSPVPGKRPSSPMRSATPTYSRPPSPAKRPPTPPPSHPYSSPSLSSALPSPAPPDPTITMRATASNFLERLATQHSPSLPSSPSTATSRLSSSLFSPQAPLPTSPNPLANLLATQFDAAGLQKKRAS